VGRPDLSPAKTPQQLAALLFESLHRKLLGLPDETLVYPAHGAGSLCGRQMSSDASSTIGRERTTNYALQKMSREQFVELLTGDLPPRPEYFHDEVERNRMGAAALEELAPVRELDPDEVEELQSKGATVLDTRPAIEFAAAHVPGSIHIALSGQFASWAARVIGLETVVVLVAEDEAAVQESRLRLARVGLENVAGSLKGGIATWIRSGRPTQQAMQISALQLADWMREDPDAKTLLDVRENSERSHGLIAGSVGIPLAELPKRLAELDRAKTVVVHCKGGYRSSIAISLLQRAGFPAAVNLSGGYDAWALSVHALPV
jgi:hydroxyacylglutathione hydrolase